LRHLKQVHKLNDRILYFKIFCLKTKTKRSCPSHPEFTVRSMSFQHHLWTHSGSESTENFPVERSFCC